MNELSWDTEKQKKNLKKMKPFWKTLENVKLIWDQMAPGVEKL